MKRQARKLEAWEQELIEARQARLAELASLDKLASSRVFKPRVIRRSSVNKLGIDMAEQASLSKQASKLDSVSS